MKVASLTARRRNISNIFHGMAGSLKRNARVTLTGGLDRLHARAFIDVFIAAK